MYCLRLLSTGTGLTNIHVYIYVYMIDVPVSTPIADKQRAAALFVRQGRKVVNVMKLCDCVTLQRHATALPFDDVLPLHAGPAVDGRTSSVRFRRFAMAVTFTCL